MNRSYLAHLREIAARLCLARYNGIVTHGTQFTGDKSMTKKRTLKVQTQIPFNSQSAKEHPLIHTSCNVIAACSL